MPALRFSYFITEIPRSEDQVQISEPQERNAVILTLRDAQGQSDGIDLLPPARSPIGGTLVRNLCYSVVALVKTSAGIAGKDSVWIGIWPETANRLTHRHLQRAQMLGIIEDALVALAGRLVVG